MGVDFEVLDKLFDEKKIEELHAELTPYSEENNVDIQWRFARASKDLAEKNQSDKKKYEEYMRMGLKAAESEYHKLWYILFQVLTLQRVVNKRVRPRSLSHY